MTERRRDVKRRRVDTLSADDIDTLAGKIAPLLITKIKNEHHEFWIDPEKHYQSHLVSDRLNKVFTDELVGALREVAQSYKKGRSLVWRLFLTLVALGALAMAFEGWWTKR